MSDDSEVMADLLREYLSIDTQRSDVSHCLGGLLQSYVDTTIGTSEEVLDRLPEIMKDRHNWFVDKLPEEYSTLKGQLLPSLEERLERSAARIDEHFALPESEKNPRIGKNKLHGLQKLDYRLSCVIEKHEPSARIASITFVEPSAAEILDELDESAVRKFLELEEISSAESIEGRESDERVRRTMPLRDLIPSYVSISEDDRLEEAIYHVSNRLQKEEERARELLRTDLWLRYSVSRLRKVLAEYEVYGRATTMTSDEARSMATQAKPGKPAEIDKSKVFQRVEEALQIHPEAWHKKGKHRGEPNVSKICDYMFDHYDDVLEKRDGRAVSKRYARELVSDCVGAIPDDSLKKWWQEACQDDE